MSTRSARNVRAEAAPPLCRTSAAPYEPGSFQLASQSMGRLVGRNPPHRHLVDARMVRCGAALSAIDARPALAHAEHGRHDRRHGAALQLAVRNGTLQVLSSPGPWHHFLELLLERRDGVLQRFCGVLQLPQTGLLPHQPVRLAQHCAEPDPVCAPDRAVHPGRALGGNLSFLVGAAGHPRDAHRRRQCARPWFAARACLHALSRRHPDRDQHHADVDVPDAGFLASREPSGSCPIHPMEPVRTDARSAAHAADGRNGFRAQLAGHPWMDGAVPHRVGNIVFQVPPTRSTRSAWPKWRASAARWTRSSARKVWSRAASTNA